MARQIFLNLPVKNLGRSVEFFTQLGFTFNPQFTDENATCMVIDDNIFAMLLVEPFFQTFTSKRIVDAHQEVEALICLSCSSEAEVDDIVKKAVAAGGKMPREPKDHGFMYEHRFEDPDGHTWELVYMRPQSQ